MGQTEGRILKECYAWRRPIPDRIQNAPDLLLGLEFYFRAFIDLNTCRSSGWSSGPIPWMDIQAYAMAHELDAEETETLHYHIAMMDSAFLKRIDEKSKNKA